MTDGLEPSPTVHQTDSISLVDAVPTVHCINARNVLGGFCWHHTQYISVQNVFSGRLGVLEALPLFYYITLDFTIPVTRRSSPVYRNVLLVDRHVY